MNQTVPLRAILAAPAAFAGDRSPWRRAPVLLAGAAALESVTAASTSHAPHGTALDPVRSLVTFLKRAGATGERVVATTLTDDGKRPTKPMRVGRDITCEVVVDHPTVSRHHASLVPPDRPGGKWMASDAGSTNGTRVGGMRLRRGVPVVLEPVDVLQFGDACLLLLEHDAFVLLVCEAASEPWAASVPDTRRADHLPGWFPS